MVYPNGIDIIFIMEGEKHCKKRVVDVCLDALAGTAWFSTFDLRSDTIR